MASLPSSWDNPPPTQPVPPNSSGAVAAEPEKSETAGKPNKQTAPDKPRMSKSRNGCVTCKARRLKCDETQPTCTRCQSRGVECGGYRKDLKWRPFEIATPESRPRRKGPPKETTVTTKVTGPSKGRTTAIEILSFLISQSELLRLSQHSGRGTVDATLKTAWLRWVQQMPKEVPTSFILDAPVDVVAEKLKKESDLGEMLNPIYRRPARAFNLRGSIDGIIVEYFGTHVSSMLNPIDKLSDNVWRNVIWPECDVCPALKHAVLSLTAFYACSNLSETFREAAVQHLRMSLRLLSANMEHTPARQCAMTTITLAFAEAMDTPARSGLAHLVPCSSFLLEMLRMFNEDFPDGEPSVSDILNKDEVKRQKEYRRRHYEVRSLSSLWSYYVTIAQFIDLDGPFSGYPPPAHVKAILDHFPERLRQFAEYSATPALVYPVGHPCDPGNPHPVGTAGPLPVEREIPDPKIFHPLLLGRIDPLMGCAVEIFRAIFLATRLYRKAAAESIYGTRETNPLSGDAAFVAEARQLHNFLVSWKPDRPLKMTPELQGQCTEEQLLLTGNLFRLFALSLVHQAARRPAGLPFIPAYQIVSRMIANVAAVPLGCSIGLVHMFPLYHCAQLAITPEERTTVIDRLEFAAIFLGSGILRAAFVAIKEVWKRRDELVGSAAVAARFGARLEEWRARTRERERARAREGGKGAPPLPEEARVADTGDAKLDFALDLARSGLMDDEPEFELFSYYEWHGVMHEWKWLAITQFTYESPI